MLPADMIFCSLLSDQKHKKKSLAQEVRRKSEISERRSKAPFNLYFAPLSLGRSVTFKSHLTPKTNVTVFLLSQIK